MSRAILFALALVGCTDVTSVPDECEEPEAPEVEEPTPVIHTTRVRLAPETGAFLTPSCPEGTALVGFTCSPVECAPNTKCAPVGVILLDDARPGECSIWNEDDVAPREAEIAVTCTAIEGE